MSGSGWLEFVADLLSALHFLPIAIAMHAGLCDSTGFRFFHTAINLFFNRICDLTQTKHRKARKQANKRERGWKQHMLALLRFCFYSCSSFSS